MNKMATARFSLRADRFMAQWVPGGLRDRYYLARFGKVMSSKLNARPYPRNGLLYVELSELTQGIWTGFRDPQWLALRLSELTSSLWCGFPKLPSDMELVSKIISTLEKRGYQPVKPTGPPPKSAELEPKSTVRPTPT